MPTCAARSARAPHPPSRRDWDRHACVSRESCCIPVLSCLCLHVEPLLWTLRTLWNVIRIPMLYKKRLVPAYLVPDAAAVLPPVPADTRLGVGLLLHVLRILPASATQLHSAWCCTSPAAGSTCASCPASQAAWWAKWHGCCGQNLIRWPSGPRLGPWLASRLGWSRRFNRSWDRPSPARC